MFYEVKFPEEISIKSTVSIEFDTNIITSKNGNEFRAANRKCRMVYDVCGDIGTKNDLDRIADFFRLVRGRSIGFRYKDWLDFHGEKQFIGRSDGLSKKFQLVKIYSNPIDGTLSYVREITKPVVDGVKIYVDDEEIEQFTVDHTSGQIFLDTAPDENSVLRATFDFDVPVRFDTDRLEIHMHDRMSGEIGNVRIVEIL
ncbi:MAG: DUF2460 domain-containing protein [Rickettsiales bacterium]|jgi:uncharacterized protein (TIGR02217 family)|nr:DUF2460 domain-containing protein [Rickettsiales bacterium]